MEQTPKNSSKKAPIVVAIIGLIAVGGYFGSKYYISHKTMEALHEQVDKANAENKRDVGASTNITIKDENRGLFTSTTTLVISGRRSDVITVPLTIRHGYSSTDINADNIRFESQGQNALQMLGGDAQKAQLSLHVSNSDLLSKRGQFKDAFIELKIPGKLAEAEKAGASFTNLNIRLERNAEGKLVASTHADNIDIIKGMGERIKTGPLNASIIYGSQWTTNLLEAGYNLDEDRSSAAANLAFENAFKAGVPDIHIDAKNVDLQKPMVLGRSHLLMGDVNFDIARDDKAKVTRLISNVKGAEYEGQKSDLDLKLALDQSVIDTAIQSQSETSPEAAQQNMLNVAKTSPRLVLDGLNIKADNNINISASGEAHINGDAVKSAQDFNNPSVVVANFTVTGLPEFIAESAEQYGIQGIKSGEPVVLKAENGRVTINGQDVFDN